MWFNTTKLDMNMFAMADDVHNLMEIFDEAASFEGRIIKRIENVLAICDILVSVLVVTIVGRYLFHSVFKKLHRSVKRTSYLPKFIAHMKPINQAMSVQGSSVKSLDSNQPIKQMKPIIQKMSVRGSKAKIWKTEVEKVHSEQKPKNIQDQTVQARPSIESIDDGDEVTLKPSERANFSAKLIGTKEWAANYLATGGRTTT